jgi:hypothetical protein
MLKIILIAIPIRIIYPYESESISYRELLNRIQSGTVAAKRVKEYTEEEMAAKLGDISGSGLAIPKSTSTRYQRKAARMPQVNNMIIV